MYKFKLVQYMIYVWRYVWHDSSACHAYVMWVELGHSHFLYVQAVSNVVTTRNGTGTKNVLKWNSALGFMFIIQVFRLWHYYCSECKPILYLDMVYCKVLLYVSVEIDLFSCEQTSVIGRAKRALHTSESQLRSDMYICLYHQKFKGQCVSIPSGYVQTSTLAHAGLHVLAFFAYIPH